VIYITGDCHQNFERFNMSIFPEQKEMTKDDYVIICGDFGGVWNKGEERRKNLALHDQSVDFIVSRCCSSST
jgi:hypothetical protein